MARSDLHWRCSLVALLVAQSLIVSCLEDPPLSTWEPVDLETVDDALAHPTGELGLVELEAFLEDVERRISYLSDTSDAMARFISAVDRHLSAAANRELADEKADPGSIRATGTRVFLALECTGRGESSDADVDNGRIVVESPTLISLEDMTAVLAGDDLLLTFEDCELPSVTIRGPAPGLFVPERSSVVLDLSGVRLDLHLPVDSATGGSEQLDAVRESFVDLSLPIPGVVIELDEGFETIRSIAAVVEVFDRSFVLDLVPLDTETSVAIRANDGSLNCSYNSLSEQMVSCDITVDRD